MFMSYAKLYFVIMFQKEDPLDTPIIVIPEATQVPPTPHDKPGTGNNKPDIQASTLKSSLPAEPHNLAGTVQDHSVDMREPDEPDTMLDDVVNGHQDTAERPDTVLEDKLPQADNEGIMEDQRLGNNEDIMENQRFSNNEDIMENQKVGNKEDDQMISNNEDIMENQRLSDNEDIMEDHTLNKSEIQTPMLDTVVMTKTTPRKKDSANQNSAVGASPVVETVKASIPDPSRSSPSKSKIPKRSSSTDPGPNDSQEAALSTGKGTSQLIVSPCKMGQNGCEVSVYIYYLI